MHLDCFFYIALMQTQCTLLMWFWMSDQSFCSTLWISTEVAYLQCCFGCYKPGAKWNCCRFSAPLYTVQPVSLYLSHAWVNVCLAVTCRLYRWQNPQSGAPTAPIHYTRHDCTLWSKIFMGQGLKRNDQLNHSVKSCLRLPANWLRNYGLHPQMTDDRWQKLTIPMPVTLICPMWTPCNDHPSGLCRCLIVASTCG